MRDRGGLLMARGETIQSSAWRGDLLRLPTQAKLVYIWSFSFDGCSLSGINEVDRAAIEFETGVAGEDLDAVLEQLAIEGKLFYDGQLLYTPARIANLGYSGVNIAKSIIKDLQRVPADHEYLLALVERYSDCEWLTSPSEGALKGLRNPFAKSKNGSTKPSKTDPLGTPSKGSISRTGQSLPLTTTSQGKESTAVVARVAGEAFDQLLAEWPKRPYPSALAEVRERWMDLGPPDEDLAKAILAHAGAEVIERAWLPGAENHHTCPQLGAWLHGRSWEAAAAEATAEPSIYDSTYVNPEARSAA